MAETRPPRATGNAPPLPCPPEAFCAFVPGPLLVIDREGIVAGATETAVRMFGDPVVGEHVESLVREPFRYTVHIHYESFFRGLFDEDGPAEPARHVSLPIEGVAPSGTVDAHLQPVTYRNTPYVVVDLADGPASGHGLSVLTSTLEAAEEGILAVDVDGTVRYCNDRYLELWSVDRSIVEAGLDEERTFGPLVEQMVDPEAWRAHIDAATGREVAAHDGVFELEDGRMLRHHIRPRYIGEELAGWVSTTQDVTDRARAQRALARSETQFRLLFERNVAGVFRARLDGTLLECNRAFATMFGYDDPADLRGEDVTLLYDDEEDRKRVLEHLLEHGAITNHELSLRCRDGQRVRVLENSSLTIDPVTDERVVVGTVIDVTRRHRLQAELEHMAYHDPLTGLANRRRLQERAEAALSGARASGEQVGLIFVDLSRFKAINDSLGHAAGDEALVQFADRLRACVRNEDLVARVGGDEFALLLTEVDGTAGARAVARRLSESLDVAVDVAGHHVHLNARMGIAVYPDTAADFDELLTHADHAMYRVERWSDSDVEIYQPGEVDRGRAASLSLEADLRQALEEDALACVLQPIVHLPTDRVVGAEALVRWEREGHGPVPTDVFVPLARRAGLGADVDRWMLQVVRGQLEGLVRRDGDLDWISLNLGPGSLDRPGLVEALHGALATLGEADGRLALEVVEDVAIESPGATLETLGALKEAGACVALDDFGTGLSSLAYLRDLPVDIIKVDRSFIHGIDENDRAERVALGVLGLAHGLGMRVLAEGVETEAQARWVREAGFDYAQGYHFGRPGSLTLAPGV